MLERIKKWIWMATQFIFEDCWPYLLMIAPVIMILHYEPKVEKEHYHFIVAASWIYCMIMSNQFKINRLQEMLERQKKRDFDRELRLIKSIGRLKGERNHENCSCKKTYGQS